MACVASTGTRTAPTPERRGSQGSDRGDSSCGVRSIYSATGWSSGGGSGSCPGRPSWLLTGVCPASVALSTKTGDRTLHHVPRPQPAVVVVPGVAGGRAGQQQVARREVDDARGVRDQLVDAVDDVVDLLILHDLAVHGQRDAQLAVVGD